AAGRVGFDVAEAGYFHRELPYDADRLAAMHPRFRDATALVDAGAVRLDGDANYVRSRDVEHVVRRTPEGDRCTCPWFGKYKGSRGPCKHVLAVELVMDKIG
ncbi:MAG: SWIM zinc finger family protein, partial [Mycobacteriales bacterium]